MIERSMIPISWSSMASYVVPPLAVPVILAIALAAFSYALN